MNGRRFYKTATVSAGGRGVMLDARTLKTPKGAAFVAPTQALAVLCSEEWNAQGEEIVPASMPITQMAFAAIDWTPLRREELIGYVASFAETDLCCHRAESPAELAARQAGAWNPLIDWGADVLGARLPVVAGVVAAPVDPAAIGALRTRAEALDDFRLTALSQGAGLAGSALIAFALLARRLDAAEAFAAAALDDLWSLEHWGEDAEARARLDRLEGEIAALARFIEALSD
jgi:chaperone required for assembly of F1-ATPase